MARVDSLKITDIIQLMSVFKLHFILKFVLKNVRKPSWDHFKNITD